MKATEREDWMPDLSDLKYGDPKMEKFRGSFTGEFNSNYKDGRRCKDAPIEERRAYFREQYAKNRDRWYKYEAKGDPRGRPRKYV